MTDDPHLSDDLLTSEVAVAMMRALMPYTVDIESRVIRDAAVVVLASVVSNTVLDGSDEDVYRLTLSLRQELYREIMRARRNILSGPAESPADA